jgi:hypothetical protein
MEALYIVQGLASRRANEDAACCAEQWLAKHIDGLAARREPGNKAK